MKDASERFHARYNVSQTYVYKINNNEYRDVFNRSVFHHITEN